MKYFLFIILSAFLLPDARALEVSYFTGVGYASIDKKGGAEVLLGVQLRPVDWLKLDIAPFTGIFRRKEDPQYSRTKDDDKQIACRDNSTGEFVDNKNCGINFKYAFESSLKVKLFDMLDIGGGVRVADRTLAYGVAILKFTPNLGLEGKFGDEYYSGVFRVDF